MCSGSVYSNTYGMVATFADRSDGNGKHVRGDDSLFLFQVSDK